MDKDNNPLYQRDLCIVTNHGKQQVFTPLLESSLGVNTFLCPDINTDKFGSFSGEIERKQTPKDTLIQKCLAGMDACNADLGVASEGSFGAHPAIPFVTSNEEWVVLMDLKNNHQVFGRYLSTEHNLQEQVIENEQGLLDFCNKLDFPEFGVILKLDDNSRFFKDAKSKEELLSQFKSLASFKEKVIAMSDMRAHRNPTRMKNIAKAIQNLIDNYISFCPSCNTPGFIITDAEKGLPCEYCNSPTNSTLFHIYTCQNCNFKQKKRVDNQFEDPMYCNFCNP